MKKNRAVALMASGLAAMFVILSHTSFSAAEDNIDININNPIKVKATGGKAIAKQRQNQQQAQEQKLENNIDIAPAFPGVNLPGVGFPGGGYGGGGHVINQITQGPWTDTAPIFCLSTRARLRAMTVLMKDDEKDWEETIEGTSTKTFIQNPHTPLGDMDEIYMPQSREEADALMRSVTSMEQIIGARFYDSKSKKDNAILVTHFQARAMLEGTNFGATVVINVRQYMQEHVIPNGAELNVGGVVSGFLNTCLRNLAGSAAISGGISSGQNTTYVSPGASFIFLRIPIPNGACFQRTTVVSKSCNPSEFIAQIKAYENEIAWCKFPCYNNQKLRFGKANAYLNWYFCEGRKNKQLLLNAIYEFGVAERDFRNGRELTGAQKFGDKPKGVKTTTLQEANDLAYKVNYNWALAVLELNGEGAEISHAQRYGLGKKGTRDMPEVWADMKQ